MINELSTLADSLSNYGITPKKWHKDYSQIAKVKADAPCYRIVVRDKHIYTVEKISNDIAQHIRRFGSNQGSFPAMNLAPLFEIGNEEQWKQIEKWKAGKEKIDDSLLAAFCTKKYWDKKTKNRYSVCIGKLAQLREVCLQNENKQLTEFEYLAEDFEQISDPDTLFDELCCVMKQAKNIVEMLDFLFVFSGSKDAVKISSSKKNVSVVFDSEKLIECEIPVISEQFTIKLNKVLLASGKASGTEEQMTVDAFGKNYTPADESMPKVMLDCGFFASLRTMSSNERCQTKYDRIESGSYPLSLESRRDLIAALDWLGAKGSNHEWVTWIRTGAGEVLFAYSTAKPTASAVKCVQKRKKGKKEDRSEEFEAVTKSFLQEIKSPQNGDFDKKSDKIQFFMLKKVDQGRNKLVYSYNASPAEFEDKTTEWVLGCKNLPPVQGLEIEVLFPLDAVDPLNQLWKQDGTIASEKYMPVSKQRGMEILFGNGEGCDTDLRNLTNSLTNLAAALHLGAKFWTNERNRENLRDSLALLGLLLYKLGSKKENYMKEFPYFLGQILKVSDLLHEAYCKNVRKGDMPTQLVGSSIYVTASEQPEKALAQLSQRMVPYLAWVKTYSHNGKGVNPRIYLWKYEQIITRMSEHAPIPKRFNDEERAQLFIGYLAALPSKMKDNKENTEMTDGGIENAE